MKTIFRRLRSRAGESLVESMAAILIFTMGSIILLSMVFTAADINATAKEADRSYNAQIVAAEMTLIGDFVTDDATITGSQIKGKVTITATGELSSNTYSDSVDVYVFRGDIKNNTEPDPNPLYTYYGGAG